MSASAMTRISAVALAAVIASVAVFSAPGQAAAPTAKAKCGNKKASFLFWPNGHGRIDSVGFPEFRTPHLEVYPGYHSTSFPPATNANADPSGATVNSQACSLKSPDPLKGDVPHNAKKLKAANIQCRFGEKMILEFTRLSNGVKVTAVLDDGTKVIELKIVNSGSKAVFNERRCTAKDPPK
jgi:hypothetical protein